MQALARSAQAQAAILLSCLVLAWCVELVDRVVFGGSLELFGIRPRRLDGLEGIVVAPLLHGSWAHLMANSIPFLVLGWLVMLRRVRDFIVVTALVMLLGGVGVWLVGSPNSVHIGASGLIFGYLGYLLARGYFERSLSAIVLALLVALLYGGVLFGLLPGQRGISWEGHLFGFLAGIIAARLLTLARPTRRPLATRL